MSKSKDKGQGHQGQKHGKNCWVIPIENAYSKVCAVGRTQQATTDDTVGIMSMTSQQAWRHTATPVEKSAHAV